MTRQKSVSRDRMPRVSPPGDQARPQAFGHHDGRDPAAERRLRSLMMASADAQARIGALAEMYSREGRERTPEQSADQYGWDVDMVSKLITAHAAATLVVMEGR